MQHFDDKTVHCFYFSRQYGLLDHLRGEFFDETKSELQWGSVDEAVAGDNHYFDILVSDFVCKFIYNN